MKRLLTILFFFVSLQVILAQGTTIANFGSNPGNLKMYMYSPSGLSAEAPLVVAIHGCAQTASAFSNDTEWNILADTYGFHVIYPETYNSMCFTWWNGNTRDNEAVSIKNMVDYAKANANIKDCDVYVTGISSGAGMTSVMCALYPDVFAGGAIMSGVPTGVSAANAGLAMAGSYNGWPAPWGIPYHSSNYWGDQIRSEHSPAYTGEWPKMICFHGTLDAVVDHNNQREIMQQWTNVHGTDLGADDTDYSFNANWMTTAKEYHDANGDWVVKTYSISGLGHAIAVDLFTGSSGPEGGNLGSFAYHVDGLWSSYWTAVDWGLTTGGCGGATAKMEVTAPLTPAISVIASPNPATNQLTLNGATISKVNSNKVQIFNISGQLIKSVIYNTGEALPINNLEKGLYIIAIDNEFGQSKSKFYKL